MKNKKIRLRATAALCLMATILSGGCGGGKDMSGDSISKEETSSVEKICAAKVIVISGQSNASGFTWSKCLKNNVSEEAYEVREGLRQCDDLLQRRYGGRERITVGKTAGSNTSGGEFVNVKLDSGAYRGAASEWRSGSPRSWRK